MIAESHAPRDHVSHDFMSAVGMICNFLTASVLSVPAKGIEHQERVETALQALGQHPLELDPGAAARTPPGNQLLEISRLADRDVVKGRSHRGVQSGYAG
jgi:hypothetical protein